MSVTDKEKARGSLYESRNVMDFGECEHGKPLLIGNCKECASERMAIRKERFRRATEAKATATICGNCAKSLGAKEPVVVRRAYSGRGYTLAATCAECNRPIRDTVPCFWCERPVCYETYSSRPRAGIFCCDSCRSKWHNRRNSAIRKRQRQRYLAKTCEVCSKEFTAKRVDAKTCSPACKQKAYRERSKEES